LIAIGHATLQPLLQKLLEANHPEWFFAGAHHVIRELAQGSDRALLTPLLDAFGTTEAEVSVPVAAGRVLDALKRR
jgi:hypothetical protein